MSTARYDVVVIGSGMGGLSAAAYLAALGQRTLLLEQYRVLGGNSHVFRRKGFEFEVGLHYVADCAPGGNLTTLFAGVGIDEDRLRWERMDPDGYDTLLYPDATFRVPEGWDAYEQRVVDLFPDEEANLRKVIGTLRAVGSGLDRSTTPASARGIAAFVAQRGPRATAWALRPLQSLFDAHDIGPRAQTLIGQQWGQHGCPPHRAPVSLHAGLLDQFIADGAWFPHGGSQVLAARLAEVVEANGGEIRTSARVGAIEVEGGRVTGVRLVDGERIATDVVVSNADIKRTYLELVGVENLRKRRVRKVDGYTMSSPFVNVYLGLDIDLRASMPRTNYFVMPDWDVGGRDFTALTEDDVDLPLDEWMARAEGSMAGFVHSPTVKDPTHAYAPEGGSSLEVMSLVPRSARFWGVATGPADGGRYRREPHYLEVKERITDLLVRRALQALPQAAGHVVWRESSTPITQERYTLCTDGSAYGIECNTRQFGLFRPAARTDVRGLFLSGATTAWGPSVEGAVISGVQAAAAVVGRDLVREVRSGKVLGDVAALPPVDPAWDPLVASTRGADAGTVTRSGS